MQLHSMQATIKQEQLCSHAKAFNNFVYNHETHISLQGHDNYNILCAK
jgi:DNA topoisomerase IB